MIIVDKRLELREKKNDPIKIGLIGSGVMGKGIINQILHYHKGIQIVSIFNRNLNKPIEFLKSLQFFSFGIAKNDSEMGQLFLENKIAITDEVDLVLDSPEIDVIIEVTGAIKFGLSVIEKAFEKRKHVVTFSAEVESFFGPILTHKAREAGVKFTLADGDQPGVTLNLFRLVQSMGFKPLVCGNIKGMEDKYRTPLTQKKFAEALDMSPEIVTSFADGTKINIEQASIANAIGFKVPKTGMNGFEVEGKHVDELTSLYKIDDLIDKGGIVDYIIGGKPGPGVFVYATIEDSYSKRYLEYMKMGKGPLYSFYHPYHLLFFDIASTITRLLDFDDYVLSSKEKLSVNVVTVAKKKLKAGEVIDGLGGYCTYGLCENFETSRNKNLLPLALAEGSILKRDLDIDAEILVSDVEITNNDILDLWNEQIDLLK